MDPFSARMDPLRDVDWVAHWRNLVLRRAAAFGQSDPSHFDRIAASYAASIAQRDDLLLEVIGSFLGPDKTLIDVGAGTGRHVTPLALRLRHVTAIEPAAGMRALIAPRANVTIVNARWLEATVEPANLVISSHVLYTIVEPVPFIQKLEAKATERVFIYLRDGQPHRLSEHLWEHITGAHAPRHPQLSDLYYLLRQIGIGPQVVLGRNKWSQSFPTFEAAVTSCRERLGETWEERACRAWLEERLQREPDGRVTYALDATFVGVIHWVPGQGA